ncbi:18893_t:CDS:1, partial [Gigaspora margarita]
SHITWVSVDNPKNCSNIGYIMFLNTHAKYFTWAVNVSPGLYYISMNNLESNSFLVLQKENDYKIINSGGHSYMCLDKSQ